MSFLPSASPQIVPLLTYYNSINTFNYCGAKYNVCYRNLLYKSGINCEDSLPCVWNQAKVLWMKYYMIT